jgi:hypothetical protein
MRVSHEPGDGSFSVVIGPDEPVPQEWARCKAAEIWRELRDGTKRCVKQIGEVAL